MARTSFPASASAYLHAMPPYMPEVMLTPKRRNHHVVYEDLEALGISCAPAVLGERCVEAVMVRCPASR